LVFTLEGISQKFAQSLCHVLAGADFSRGEASFHDVVALLPKKKSADAEIVAYLTDLCALNGEN
jgi:hypothetical protein